MHDSGGSQRDELLEAVASARELVEEAPVGHSNRAGRLHQFARELAALSDRNGEQEVLAEAIECAREAVALTPVTDSYRPGRLSNLGNYLSRWCALTGQWAALEEAVVHAREAVAQTPEEHGDRPGWLNNLGSHLSQWYALTGGREVLTEAVNSGREAVRLAPVGHSDRPAFLNNLGNHLGNLYALTGDTKVLREAIDCGGEAVGLTPDGEDRASFLSNLGNHLRDWYLFTGEREQLRQAVGHAQEAVDLTPAGESDRPNYLHNLANHLGDWYGLTGEPDALDKAIASEEEAIELTPDGHPDLPGYLNGLGLLMWARYVLTGDEETLEDAIVYCQVAVDRTPAEHHDRPALLNNLGNNLSAFYALTGEQVALEEAIACGREALAGTAADHYDRPTWLYNLGNHLSDWYRLTGERPALTEAIDCARQAVQVGRRRAEQETPPAVLRGLYVSLARHLLLRDEGGDWEEARGYLEAALQQQHAELGRQRGERPGMDYLRDKEYVYRLLVQCCLELANRHEQQGDLMSADQLREQAWSTAEQGKGRLFAAMLAAERKALAAPDPRVAELLSRIEKLRHKLATRRPDDAAAPDPEELSRQVNRYSTELQELDPELASLTMARPLPLAQVRAVLPPQARLLEFYPLAHELVLFTIDHDGLRTAVAPISYTQIKDWTAQLDSCVQTPGWNRYPTPKAKRLRALLAELAAVLEPALQELLGPAVPLPAADVAPELILVPTGPLHRWPLHLLPWGGGILWDAWSVSYVPTTDTLYYCAGRHPEADGEPLLLAPDLGLAGSFGEALLAKARGWRVAIGDAATPRALAASKGNLALVTHVRAAPKQGGTSAVKLFAGGHLGWVTAVEILRLMRDRPPGEHGELGSCAAHYEEAREGDHLQGLTRSFLKAGLRSLTTTLWPVDDLAACFLGARTRELMGLPGRSKAACLRQAALEFRQHGWEGAAAWMMKRVPTEGAGRKSLLALTAAYLSAAGEFAEFLAVWQDCQAAPEEEEAYAAALAPLIIRLQEWADRGLRAVGRAAGQTMKLAVTELHWGPSVLIGDSQFAGSRFCTSECDNR